jgi:uncharacterized membrane protein YgdD (TMEM256/DUF423 family)
VIASRTILIAAALAGAAAVACGAFGAHALRATLDETALATWRTAIDYAFWHALALLGAASLARDGVTRALAVATFAFVAGIVLFSGSLCALALGAPRALGIVTPFGGVAFIVGWLALGIEGWRRR